MRLLHKMVSVLEQTKLEKIVDFIIKHTPYTDREKIEEYIKLHLLYHTALIAFDNDGEVACVVRWNIEDNGLTANILDLIVAPKYRWKGYIRKAIREGLRMFPTVKVFKWERNKYPNREECLYSTSQMLRR